MKQRISEQHLSRRCVHALVQQQSSEVGAFSPAVSAPPRIQNESDPFVLTIMKPRSHSRLAALLEHASLIALPGSEERRQSTMCHLNNSTHMNANASAYRFTQGSYQVQAQANMSACSSRPAPTHVAALPLSGQRSHTSVEHLTSQCSTSPRNARANVSTCSSSPAPTHVAALPLSGQC